MEQFKLIGRATVFNLVKEYKAAGFIPSVKGITVDGKFETCARVADVEFIEEGV